MPRPIPGAGKTKTGYLWALTRDDRGWNGGDPPAVVFTDAPGAAGSDAMDILWGFDGIRKSTAMPGMTPWPNSGAWVARL